LPVIQKTAKSFPKNSGNPQIKEEFDNNLEKYLDQIKIEKDI